jgi:hypothetical protein
MAKFDDEITKKNENIEETYEQYSLEGIFPYKEIYNFEGAFDHLASGIIEDWYS